MSGCLFYPLYVPLPYLIHIEVKFSPERIETASNEIDSLIITAISQKKPCNFKNFHDIIGLTDSKTKE